ncbi:HXXEE domain-containing protein [Georgenia ruanii]|uniref:HXXEE domain-containing protein n=1 Tax=Georgenia ruanii TaxID=348442 RepID=A0A7J9UYH4_9MICO|nr:HXXEE domain-containing protein [Georgenia ruanii]MPV89675.1 HXXEE domain-containing protein [Georgenia ruanii]
MGTGAASRRPAASARPPAGAAWALVTALTVHNAEEALTMGPFLRSGAAVGPVAPGPDLLVPFLVVVTALTVGAWLLAGAATAGRRWAGDALAVLAVVMVVNVVVPHVPGALLTGGYVPGVVSAVVVNLPVALAYLRRARRRRQGAETSL